MKGFCMNKLLMFVFALAILAGESVYAMNAGTVTVTPNQQIEFVSSIGRQGLVYSFASAVCFGAYATGNSESLVWVVGTGTLVFFTVATIMSCWLRRQVTAN
jgi:hypothetical protein